MLMVLLETGFRIGPKTNKGPPQKSAEIKPKNRFKREEVFDGNLSHSLTLLDLVNSGWPSGPKTNKKALSDFRAPKN